MKIGITTYSLNNFDFQVQLNSMLNFNVKPDFIIIHYSGFRFTLIKYFRFLIKSLRQYRFKSINFILAHNKKKANTSNLNITLSQEEIIRIDEFINSVPKIKAKGINDRSTISKIRNMGKAIIICNSGILRKEVLNLPETIFLNIHASRLPQYRGMNNVEWALYENNSIYVTIHRISRSMDEGDILYQEEIEIDSDNLKLIEYYRKYCFFKSNDTVGKAIFKLINNEIAFIKQDKKNEPLLQYYVMHPILKKHLQEKLLKSI